ncbi:hypothetical protein FXO38_16842 [Capsicum annuum]|nr:hypothetical protein FXO38_16842 [Capsicum annuum]
MVPLPAFALEYETHVGGESSASFHKESDQTREDSQNLGFEEATQIQKSTDFGEEFGAASTGVGEEVNRVSTGVGEELYGRDYIGVGEEFGPALIDVGEDVGGFSASISEELCGGDSNGAGEKVGPASTGVGGSSAATASEFLIIESDWESASKNSKDSGYGNLFDEIDDEYGSDVHKEVRTLREDEEASYEIDNDLDADVEDEVQQASDSGKKTRRAKKTKERIAAAASTLNVVGVAGRGRGTVGVARRGRGTVDVFGRSTGTFVVSGWGRGTIGAGGRGRETFGVAGRGRGTSVAAISNIGDVASRGSGTTFKRPRFVGMGVLHTQSGFTIHNPGMPLNSSIVTENLGHHKPRSGVK